jgi:hypothetical protein
MQYYSVETYYSIDAVNKQLKISWKLVKRAGRSGPDYFQRVRMVSR